MEESKETKYAELKKDIDYLLGQYKQNPLSYIARLSSVAAILYNGMKNIKYLGFYLVVD